ncbi:MAG: sulfatase [Thermoleophilaceae bacterium]|nr:sulfatase [Thermoleophilaceae bacterium]
MPLAALLVLLVAASPAAAQPNVVVLMTDDQTEASLSYMRNVNGLLGAEGTTFQQSFSSFPLCCPSRTTHLTGQYAHNHRVLHNAGPFGGYAVFDHANSLPVWLQQAGYRTMHVGRYLNGYSARSGIPAGWSDWHGMPHANAFNYASWKVNENGVIRSYPDDPGEHQTDFLAERAGELIEDAASDDAPFFLSLWFSAPHSGAPRDPDDPTWIRTPSPAERHRDAFAGATMPRLPNFDEANMYDKPQVVADRPRFTPDKEAAIEENWRQELETLLGVDEAVAYVIDVLAETGELENTLIVYTADNGYMHGEHRALAEKVLPYEPSIRVPLILRGPGVPRGRIDDRLVANVDVPATILDVTGAQPGRVQDGRSLVDLLTDPGAEWGRDILIENGYGANRVPAYRAIRNYRFLYVEHNTTGEYELYDLEEDPYQLRSRDGSARYAAVQRDLRARLRRLKRCAGASCLEHPLLKLHVRPRPTSCVRGDLRVYVSGPEKRAVVAADVLVGHRRVARVSAPPLMRRIPEESLRPGRPFRLRVRAETRDGRRVTLDRRVRACR